MVSPSGPRLAGKHGVSLLSLSMSVAEGFAAVGQAWGVVEEQAAKARPPAPDRRTLAGPRHHAPRRDHGAGDRGLHLRPARTSPTTSAAAPASCRSPTRSTASRRRRASYVEAYADVGQRRDRHARRRHRLHRGPARAVGRVRHVPPARPRLGRPGGDAATRTGCSPARSSRTSRASSRRPAASHDWATAKRGELFGARRPGDPQRHHQPTSRRRRPTPPAQRRDGGGDDADARRRAARRRDRRPRRRPRARARLRSGARAGEGVRHLRVRPALRHSTAPTMLAARRARWRACPTSATPPLDLGRDVFMGHEFAAEVLEVGPDTVGAGAGHDRHLDPDPADDAPACEPIVYTQRRCRRLRRADAAVGAAAASRCPTGSTPGTPR